MWKVASSKSCFLFNTSVNNSNQLNLIRLLSNWNTKVIYFMNSFFHLTNEIILNFEYKGSS
jgi:hypothetical protein